MRGRERNLLEAVFHPLGMREREREFFEDLLSICAFGDSVRCLLLIRGVHPKLCSERYTVSGRMYRDDPE